MALLKISLTLCLRTLWIQHPLPSLVQQMSFSIRLWSVEWLGRRMISQPMGVIRWRQYPQSRARNVQKNNLTKSISPCAQQRPAAWHRTCDLHEAIPIIHRSLENTQQEQASSKGAAMPLTLKAHPFLLLFAIWITWMLLTCWLHLQACAIKGVRMRSSPRFAERRLDLMIWAH